MNKQSFKSKIKNYYFLGVLSVGPLLITLWIIISISKFLDNLIFSFIPGKMTVLEINGFPIYGIGLIASFFLFVLIGFFAKGVLGKALNSVADHFFMSIPGIRGIYKTTKQITNNLFSAKGSTSFKKVVYAPFPSENSKCIAFLTGKTESGECMVFVPTAPNPTSGYVLIYKESQLQDCSLTVNEALQVVVSCGAMSPEKSAPPL